MIIEHTEFPEHTSVNSDSFISLNFITKRYLKERNPFLIDIQNCLTEIPDCVLVLSFLHLEIYINFIDKVS